MLTVRLSKFFTKGAVGSWVRSWVSDFCHNSPLEGLHFTLLSPVQGPCTQHWERPKLQRSGLGRREGALVKKALPGDTGDPRVPQIMFRAPNSVCFYVQEREKGRAAPGPVAELGRHHVSAPGGFLLSGTAGLRPVLRFP